MPEEIKHPVILSKDFHIADLILRHIHGEVGHGGRNHTLSRLCQKYWIPGATVLIRKILSQCVFCRRINAIPGQQQMADLPLDRVSPDEPPFTDVGVDYTWVRKGPRHLKCSHRHGRYFSPQVR